MTRRRRDEFEGSGYGRSPSDLPKCDFCSAYFPTWIHRAKPFTVDRLRWMSDGEWAACDKCHRFLLEGDQEGLAMRSLNTLKGIPDSVRPEMLQKIKDMHAGFWEGYKPGDFYRQGHVTDAQHRRGGSW